MFYKCNLLFYLLIVILVNYLQKSKLETQKIFFKMISQKDAGNGLKRVLTFFFMILRISLPSVANALSKFYYSSKKVEALS